ncbi:MAG: peptidase domain-containing ABC transporter [Caulobacteraceae bacterium]
MIGSAASNALLKPKVPVFTSSELAECGLACLAMVGRFHGHDIDLNGLRQRFSTSIAGVTVATIISIADQLSMSSRPLNLEIDMLSHVRLPAILHWNLNHFVVLTAINSKGFVVHDPALGRCSYSKDIFSRHFTGVAIEIVPRATFNVIKACTKIDFSDLITRAVGVKRALAQVLIISLFIQILSFVAPLQIQFIVDDAIERGDASLLTIISLAFTMALIFQIIFEAARTWSIQVVGSSIFYQIGGNVVAHLLRLPSGFFERRHVGDITSRMSSINAIQESLARGLVAAFIDGLASLISGGLMFLYSPSLSICVICGVAINALIGFCIYPYIRASSSRMLEASAVEQTYLMESIRAATITKIMGGESQREAGWRNRFSASVRATLSMNRFQTLRDALYNLSSGLQLIVVIFLGASNVIHSRGMSIGMLLAFIAFRQLFTDRTGAFIMQASQFRLLGLHLERISDIISVPAEEIHHQNFPTSISGALSLRRISFSYGVGEANVINHFSLDIEPGDFVAITGPSGCGKSTLLKLILGVQEPSDGEIRLENLRATPALWRQWRLRVGFVAQDDRLYSGSLAENIAFFDARLDMSRVEKAANMALVHEDIMAKPMQYLSLVGDMGSSLSGGQKQRLLLARALYRNPSILILDEGTANLDEHMEELIADIVSGLPITRIVVAHRPALIRRASKIISMKPGEAPQLLGIDSFPLPG